MPGSRRHVVNAQLQSRAGNVIGPGGGLQSGEIPTGVSVEDGLTANEAVAMALWNNAAYQELLAQLGISRARLFEAGLITDPQFVVFLPIGTKQLEFTTFQAVDALWLRPIRERAAELDLSELSQQMIQNGLNVARDVRVAHVNLLQAQERAALTQNAQRLREQIEALSQKRLNAGDISELEFSTARIEALRAAAVSASARQDVSLAQERLRVLIGGAIAGQSIVAVDDVGPVVPRESTDELVAIAHAMRPDLRAIEIRSAAACTRAELARNQFMNLDAVFDSNEEGRHGFEAGYGLRMTLPVFNGNKGGIAVADAQLQQVNRQYTALRDQIELEVRTAATQVQQAAEQRQLIDDQILPTLVEAQELARRNYEIGGVPFFLVLQTTSQLVDAQLSRQDAEASERRAIAELERSIGRRIEGKPAPVNGEQDVAFERVTAQLSLNDGLAAVLQVSAEGNSPAKDSRKAESFQKASVERSKSDAMRKDSYIIRLWKPTDGEPLPDK